MSHALVAENLSVAIDGAPILNGVDLTLKRGVVTGLVGGSGAGKSITAFALIGLLPTRATVKGKVHLHDVDLLKLSSRESNAMRGAAISIIFQEPMSALNPLQTIEAQIAEVFEIHKRADRADAIDQARAVLEQVGLGPDVVAPDRYPHELSGGQRQRVVIAMAIALKPAVLIADEPTTALDVMTQRAILELLRSLCKQQQIALLLITHDLSVIGDIADNIAIMREGKILSQETPEQIAASPAGAVFRRMLAVQAKPPRPSSDDQSPAAALTVCEVTCAYPKTQSAYFTRGSCFDAVKDVSFTIPKGRALAVVGESGSGKTTLAEALLGLRPMKSGSVAFNGEAVDYRSNRSLRRLRRNVQIVFQDPYSSFNPRKRILDTVTEPLNLLEETVSRSDAHDRAIAALTEVGLDPEHLSRLPDAFSGGQRQRIAIARALIIEPDVIVLDEATSALDVEARMQVLSVLQHLRQAKKVSYLFISHDLNVVRAVADRIAVMKNGVFVENAPADEILTAPKHAYTKSLVDEAARLEQALDSLRTQALQSTKRG